MRRQADKKGLSLAPRAASRMGVNGRLASSACSPARGEEIIQECPGTLLTRMPNYLYYRTKLSVNFQGSDSHEQSVTRAAVACVPSKRLALAHLAGVLGQPRPQGGMTTLVLDVSEMPWLACRSTAFSTATVPGNAVDRMRFTAFLLVLATEEYSVDHSVLEQALQALQASDERVVELLVLRHRLASQLAQAARDQEAPASFEERVAAVVSRLVKRNSGPLDTRRISAIFEFVIQLTEPLSMGLAARNGAPKKG